MSSDRQRISDRLAPLAKEHGLRLIEDSWRKRWGQSTRAPAGTLGEMGVFAFYPNKQITTGEGGVVVTNDDEMASLMKALRNQGRAPGDTWLQHTYLGYNYRMDEMSAALGVAQMARLEELLAARQRVADWYAQYLAGSSVSDRLSLPGNHAPKLVCLCRTPGAGN